MGGGTTDRTPWQHTSRPSTAIHHSRAGWAHVCIGKQGHCAGRNMWCEVRQISGTVTSSPRCVGKWTSDKLEYSTKHPPSCMQSCSLFNKVVAVAVLFLPRLFALSHACQPTSNAQRRLSCIQVSNVLICDLWLCSPCTTAMHPSQQRCWQLWVIY